MLTTVGGVSAPNGPEPVEFNKAIRAFFKASITGDAVMDNEPVGVSTPYGATLNTRRR